MRACRFGVDGETPSDRRNEANDGERWIDRSKGVCHFPSIDQAPNLCRKDTREAQAYLSPMHC